MPSGKSSQRGSGSNERDERIAGGIVELEGEWSKLSRPLWLDFPDGMLFLLFTIVGQASINSFVSFVGSTADAKWSMRVYNRTREQNVALGLVSEDEAAQSAAAAAKLQTGGDVPEGGHERVDSMTTARAAAWERIDLLRDDRSAQASQAACF
jgi:hypothetical protein